MHIEIGQVWKTRNGTTARVLAATGIPAYPWLCKEETSGVTFTVTANGYQLSEYAQLDRDIVELIQPAEHAPKDADAMRAVLPGGIDYVAPSFVRYENEGGTCVRYIREPVTPQTHALLLEQGFCPRDALSPRASTASADDFATNGGFFMPKKVADDVQHYLHTGQTAKTVDDFAEVPADYFAAVSADDFTTAVLEINHPYHTLAVVLLKAFEQAASGKGKDRHAAGNTPFDQQPMATINRENGSVDGFLFQARKKALESKRLPYGRDIAEVLGAINYLAGAAIAYETWAKKDEQ